MTQNTVNRLGNGSQGDSFIHSSQNVPVHINYKNENFTPENLNNPGQILLNRILTKLSGYFPGICIITSTISKLSIFIVRYRTIVKEMWLSELNNHQKIYFQKRSIPDQKKTILCTVRFRVIYTVYTQVNCLYVSQIASDSCSYTYNQVYRQVKQLRPNMNNTPKCLDRSEKLLTKMQSIESFVC